MGGRADNSAQYRRMLLWLPPCLGMARGRKVRGEKSVLKEVASGRAAGIILYVTA